MIKSIFIFIFTLSLLNAATFNVSTAQELQTALSTSEANGENDTIIIADGTYTLTSALSYTSNEDFNITLEGSNQNSVILSANSQSRVLTISQNSGQNNWLILKNLTIQDGASSTHGGGVIAQNIHVENCTFSNNHSDSSNGTRGGGFFAYENATVLNSTFSDNSASYHGGGFMAYGNVDVNNSTFSTNTIKDIGSFGHYGSAFSCLTAVVNNSTFSDNVSEWDSGHGGVIHQDGSKGITVNNCKFENNDDDAISFDGGTITNSIFHNNSKVALFANSNHEDNNLTVHNTIVTNSGEDAIYTRLQLTLSNSLLFDNLRGIKFGYNSNGISDVVIVNSLFDNSETNIEGSAIVDTLENNYIDTTTIDTTTFVGKNNIFTGVTLGFFDQAHQDFRLLANSDLIDAGVSSIEGVALPTIDIEGNSRIMGSSIDIGPYEYYFSSKPTINLISFSGNAEANTPLTFSVNYLLPEGRSLTEIAYDFNNDGNFTTTNTYTFSSDGAYTVTARVTDNTGSFSTKTKTVLITADSSFETMSNEQKLVQAIDPQYYDAILEIISNKEDTAQAVGKQYVQDNLAEFGLVTEASTHITSSDIDALVSGWTLIGTKSTITDLTIFNSANLVWIYLNGKWELYTPNTSINDVLTSLGYQSITTIPEKSGIWVLK
jgi:hypothetical protein